MNKTSSNISVLIPDCQDHKPLVLQVIHSLSLRKDVTIYGMTTVKQNYLKYSRYLKHLSYYPDTEIEGWISNINKEVEKFQIDIVLPVFEIGIRKLIENKNLLKSKNKLCILPSLHNFSIAGDKGKLYTHLSENGFPCPESVVTEANELPDLKSLNFPVIAKPVIGFGGGDEIIVLKDQEDVNKYSKSAKFKCNAIYQNFISGYDLCCNVLCNNGEVVAYSIQNASISDKDDVTPQTGFRFIQEQEVIEITKKVMQSLDWSGVANIDFRYDEVAKTFKIIEINTRYWINIDASAIANVNFPYLHCLLTLDQPKEWQEANRIAYLNLKGLVRQIRKKPSTIFKFGYLKNNTPLMFALKDPIPMVYRFVWRTKNIIVGKLK